ncbi:MAG: TetR family transcriptional regulator [Deltaproteobacteria bacterium]|nr:TetR family transcriptional regulator [Deltaproteobacteria bacterium]
MNAENSLDGSKRMNVKVLCEMAGISRSTFYQYLKTGLLHPPLKGGPTKLRYDQSHLQRLREIRHFREKKKLSLSEMQKMFHVSAPQVNELFYNTEDLRNMIIDKAFELISKKGFAKTKIGDIADALNMGKGTFYLYFKNKEELFFKCIERFSEIFLPKEVWEEIRKERQFFQRASKRMYFMLDSFPTFMGIISVAKLALRGTDPELAKSAIDCFKAINRPLIKELERGMKKGISREVDAGLISFVMFGIGEAAGYWRMMHPDYSIEDTTEKIMDFIQRGLFPPDSNGSDISSHSGLQGFIEDHSGTKIKLQGICFNGQKEISGKLGEGNLQISLKKIAIIEIKSDGSECFANVAMTSKEKVKIKIDGSIIVSGDSAFGDYSIPIAKTARIDIVHKQKSRH